ncbi:hypothetical protein [Halosegnis marinus]|uniref:hypothetical protein n=1 Tax=Halosegnis marinus TaxID=3034023 RepID=UPI0036220A15
MTAVVAPDGTVLRLDALYVENDRVQFATVRIEGATFEPPGWAPNGTNATA